MSAKSFRTGESDGGLVELRAEEFDELERQSELSKPRVYDPSDVDHSDISDYEPTRRALLGDEGRRQTGPGSLDEPTALLAEERFGKPTVERYHVRRPTGGDAKPMTPGNGPREPGSERSVKDAMLGQVLGSYEIVSQLGEGGMGKVYLAEHVKLGRKVALKLLRPEYAVKRDAVQRFFQEARAVNKIGHENIVDITDFVELPTGETFIIMEFLRGRDLAELQRGNGAPISLDRAMRIALQVCQALDAAHRAGIVHRDLKPDNIFLVHDGNKHDFVKLLDFGVAKLIDQGDDEDSGGWKTAAGAVIGTPAYMSPEQASGIPVDNRADIYSLGAILYELFTGHPVFRAKSFGEFVVKHMNDEPVPPRLLENAPAIPLALEHVILRCLAKDPNSRYQSVVELREDLARATATVETAIRAPTHENRGEQAALTKERRPSRRRQVFTLVVSMLLAGMAAVTFWFAAGLDQPQGRRHASIELDAASVAGTAAENAGVGGSSDLGQAKGREHASGTHRQTVAFDSRPSGATVYRIDGRRVRLGKTPFSWSSPESIGQTVGLEFVFAGHKRRQEWIVVEDAAKVDVDLEPNVDKPSNAIDDDEARSSAPDTDAQGSPAAHSKGNRVSPHKGSKPHATGSAIKKTDDDTSDPVRNGQKHKRLLHRKGDGKKTVKKHPESPKQPLSPKTTVDPFNPKATVNPFK